MGIFDKLLSGAQRHGQARDARLDAISGCLIGGAAGDALGYAVEFMSDEAIFARYGEQGITAYALDPRTNQALISDDTQMTLFTANGLLCARTASRLRAGSGRPSTYVERAYRDWLLTQRYAFEDAGRPRQTASWLCDVPELYARRAPGNTCLAALNQGSWGDVGGDYLREPINHSKGCGGVMRVTPVALAQWAGEDELDMEAAQTTAITHGHPLGYMPSAMLCHIIRRIVSPGEERLGLKAIALEARDAVGELFAGEPYMGELMQLVDNAIRRAENDRDDLTNIRALGEGWVADEALAIALYCSLRHEGDFSGGIIAAVNHSGDSDSTGAIAGNILGAMVGYEAIDEKWKANLECADVIAEIARDIGRADEDGVCRDAAWRAKYDR